MTLRVTPILLLLLTMAVSCDRNNASSTGPDPSKARIAVIPKGTSHIFWKSVHAGAKRYAREHNLPEIIWQGPPTEEDVNQQINIAANVQTAGCDALVLAPINKDSLNRTIETAFKKMPVVVYDSGCTTEQYTAYVATDNYKGGQLAGRHLLKLLGPEGGEVAVVLVQAGSASTEERERGFFDVVKAAPNVKVVFQQYGDSNTNKSMNVANDALTAHPNLKGFFGPNESSTAGILNALRQHRKAGQVKFVGFDSTPEFVQGLRKGEIHALVLQDPVKMGYLAVKAAHEALQKKPVSKNQPIEPTLVTPDNMNQPEIVQLHTPDLSDNK
jgi:ribose transport system substrate-binding protein